MKGTTMFEIISRVLNIKCTIPIRFTNIFITSVFLLSVISPTFAAPHPYLIAVNPPNHKTVFSTIFSNPCGVDREDTSLGRHGSQHPMKLVKKQLNLTLTDFQNINRTLISVVYKSTMNLTKQFVNRCLPHKQFQEYMSFKRNHRSITNEKMIHHILPKLYGKLYLYGEAFEKLSAMVPHIDSSVSLNHDRKKALGRLKSTLRALMCEVETSINATNTVVQTNTEHCINRVGNDWPKNPDRTGVLIIDMSTFSQYKTFLEDWLRIIREVDMSRNERKAEKGRPLKKNPRRPKLNKKRNTKPRKIVRKERS